MNALFAFEAKRFLLEVAYFCAGQCREGYAQFDPRLERGLEGVAKTPHGHGVEVKLVAVASFQRVDAEVLLGDQGENAVEGAHDPVLWACGG